MKIINYPDGGSYVISENESSITYRINTYRDLFMLKSLKDANPQLEEVTIPCMFQQQHDRRFNQNESFELKLVCDFINSCNFKKVKVFHPHSDVTPALLNNCEVIDNSQFIAQIFIHLAKMAAGTKKTGEILKNNLILMSSDAGGFKPLMKLCDKISWQGETYSAAKSRKYENNKSILAQIIDRQDFQGKDVLIIDDICVYGGTFIGLANLLKQKNVGKLYLAVSHLTVNSPNPELFNLFDTVYTTNSKGIEYYPNKENLKIINLF